MKLNIANLDKAEVLAALYNASKQQGMGFLHTRGQLPMSKTEAQEELKYGSSFDYLHGRVMKVDIGTDTMDDSLYNRDNGEGAAAVVIERLRAAS